MKSFSAIYLTTYEPPPTQVIVTGANGPLYGVPSVSVGAAQMLLPHGQLLNVAKSSGHYLDYIYLY